VATADEQGRFSIADAPPGKLELTAAQPGYRDTHLEVEAGSGGLAVELARCWTLEVKLSGASPIARALVTLAALEGPPDRGERVVGADGVALFEDVRGARHRVVAFAPGLAPAKVDVDPRAAASVTLELGAGARASGTVSGPDGNVLPGAAILRGHDPDEDLEVPGAFALLLAMTEAKGEFAATISAEGEDVVVSCPGFAPLVAHLAPGDGQRFQLAAGARVAGRTLARDGSPQSGVGVALEGPLSRRAVSGPDGSFVFEGLLPGRYRLRRHDASPDSPAIEANVGASGDTSVELRAP
jgi:hypothetical protein